MSGAGGITINISYQGHAGSPPGYPPNILLEQDLKSKSIIGILLVLICLQAALPADFSRTRKAGLA